MSKNLTIHFEGYWQCRQATDPDPSRDKRGASGYTFAIGNENDLDEIIRLQRDEIEDVDFRKSYPPPNYPETHALAKHDEMEDRFGIFVSKVELDGVRFKIGEDALLGGKVRWLPYGEVKHGPRFELRNTIIYNPGNNSGIFMPVDPFHLHIEGKDSGVLIGRDDPLNPENPEEKVWQIDDSEIYKRRCPRDFYSDSDEALEAVAPGMDSPYTTYIQMRKEWIELELTDVESELAKLISEGGDPKRISELEVQKGAYLNRLYVIEEFTPKIVNNRLGSRLGMLARWEHDLLGENITLKDIKELGGEILTGCEDKWLVKYWMGGFDGDSMRGYMRGSLQLPYREC